MLDLAIDQLPNEEADALCLAAQAGDTRAADRLVRSVLRLVNFHAHRKGKVTEDEREELRSAALVGVANAIKTWKADGGAPFRVWVSYCIKSEVAKAVSQQAATSAAMPNDMGSFLYYWKLVTTQLEHEMGTTPTDADIVARFPQVLADRQLSKPVTAAMMLRLKTRRALFAMVHADSLNREFHSDGYQVLEVGDLLADDVDVQDLIERGATLDGVAAVLADVLTEREWFILRRRLQLDGGEVGTLLELGQELGVSREAIRQAQNTAIAKLGHPMTLRRLLRLSEAA